MKFADSLGFVDLEAKDPVADQRLGLHLIHMTSSAPWETKLEGIERWHSGFVQCILRQAQSLEFVESRRGLENMLHHKIAVVLGLQNPPQDTSPIKAASWMYRNGICFTTLAYGKKEKFGYRFAGSWYDQNEGLTQGGKDLLRFCSDFPLVIDLSHSSPRTAYDVQNLVERENLVTKVVATHVGINEVYKNPRNLPADVLKWVTGRPAGLVGIPFFTFFTGPQEADESEEAALTWCLAHIRYAVEEFGLKKVCLGTDTPYKQYSLEEHKAHFAKLAAELDAESLATQGRAKKPELQHPHYFYHPRKMSRLFEVIASRLSEEVAEAVCGNNFWNWCLQNLPE